MATGGDGECDTECSVKCDVECGSVLDLRSTSGERLEEDAVLASLVVKTRGNGEWMLVKSLADTGSSRHSFIFPEWVEMLGLVGKVAQHQVGGNFTVPTTSCVDVVLRLGEAVVLVTMGIMDLPVPVLFGMDFMRRLGAVVDLVAGSVFFSELSVTCDLDRHGESLGGLDTLALLEGAGDHDFRAEVQRLVALPDLTDAESLALLAEMEREFEQLFWSTCGC